VVVLFAVVDFVVEVILVPDDGLKLPQHVRRLELFHLLPHHDHQRPRVTDEKRHENVAQPNHLPFHTALVLRKSVETVCIVQLKEIANGKEREDETETSPHRRLEALNRHIHSVALA